jgi:SAM-dependent methyltransferase
MDTRDQQRPPTPASVVHREDEYDSSLFEILLDMQARHFWYLGRHRFLLRAVRQQMRQRFPAPSPLSAIDLGGGCGGWIRYLNQRAPALFAELALADSSPRALTMAGQVVGPDVSRQQVDLLQLPWGDAGRWDVAFLLDVLEHLPQDAAALAQIRQSLKPGGLLFVTTPALRFFWSYNDEIVHHVKRYSRTDYRQLAAAAGLELLDARYFMFFLSPLLLLSRLGAGGRRKAADLSPAQVQAIIRRTHQVPMAPLNAVLRGIFALETPLGLRVRFPWGSSILGVFRRPA